MTPTDGHSNIHPTFDGESFHDALTEFGGIDAEHRVVARQARGLANSGQAKVGRGAPLTDDKIMQDVRDAPDSDSAMHWNWWLDVLETAYGDYRKFRVRRILRA